ncbi:MAG: T9SS type A sorting domain-containing protein [Flavobacteriales bacterium]
MKTQSPFSPQNNSVGIFLVVVIAYLSMFSIAALAQDFAISNDPQAIWSNVSGTSGYDKAEAVVSEYDGNIYTVGSYNSPSVTGASPFNNAFAGGTHDGFITKTDRFGATLWSIFLGGSGSDYCTSAVLTHAGNLAVCGYTSSSNIEGSNGSSFYGGSRDAFVALIDKDGTLLWFTYVGGNADDYGLEITTDFSDNVFIAGRTNSSNISYESFTQSTYGGGANDGFIAKLNEIGSVEYFTYIGGSAIDEVKDIIVGNNNDLYICGFTGGMPSMDGLSDIPYQGGSTDAFMAHINENHEMDWARYVGGAGSESLAAMAMDAEGHVLAAGNTVSGQMLGVPGSSVLTPNNQDLMLMCFDEVSQLSWCKFVTGNGVESARDLHVDLFGNIYLAGTTTSTNLNVTNEFQSTLSGNSDILMAKWNADATLDWLSYYGGNGDEWMGHLSSDRFGKVMMSGYTSSTNFNATNNTTAQGNTDAFFTRISDCANPEVTIHTNDTTTFCDGETVLLTACGATDYYWMNEDTLNITEVDTTLIAVTRGFNIAGCYGLSNKIEILALPLPEVSIEVIGETIFCANGQSTLVASGGLTYEWNDDFHTTIDKLVVDTAGVYRVIGSGENGCFNSDMVAIEFYSTPEAVMTSAMDTVCVSGAPVSLIGLPLGGTFIGPGIDGNAFNPAIAGGGTHEVNYMVVDENGCVGISEPVMIEVFYFPTVLFTVTDTLCTFDAPMQLVGEPAGGSFSGDGVVGDIFDPTLPGTGPQNIVYSYVDSHGCTNTDSHVIYVDPCVVASTGDLNSATAVQVYPNPAQDQFFIETSNYETYSVAIYTASGQLVERFNGRGRTQVQSSQLNAGVYYLHIAESEMTTVIPMMVTK